MSRRYLLVDDNEAFVENLAEILTDAGAVVDVAHDGAAAITHVKAHRYDALVTDMRMPGMSGAELLRALRTIDPGLPAVLLSAYSQDELLHMARRDGLLAVLSKPQETPKLLHLLEAARRDGAVVLVEDDVALAENLSEALCDRGLTPVTATDVRELSRVSAKPFAVLVDLKVPGGAPGAAIDEVKSRWPGVPLLVMTAFVHDATTSGHEVFQKPFDTAAMLARLEALYARPKTS